MDGLLLVDEGVIEGRAWRRDEGVIVEELGGGGGGGELRGGVGVCRGDEEGAADLSADGGECGRLCWWPAFLDCEGDVVEE